MNTDRTRLLRQRRNLASLSQRDVADLKDAFGRLKGSTAERNYSFFASVHFVHTTNVHESELFLPWHRAFIQEFEDALRVFKPGLTLPYWDWIGQPSIPSAFASNGSNPLYAERYTEVFRKRNNLELPTRTSIKQLMTDTNFFLFGGGIGNAGDLECAHNMVHLWVGPVMSQIASSPCDPIFWVHHANVDRLWAAWQSTHPGANPFNLCLPLEGLKPEWTVQGTLDINHLGYEYVESVQTMELKDGGFERSTVLGSVMSPPTSFSRAELRIQGLKAMTQGLNYIDVFVGRETKRAARVALYGVNSMTGDSSGHLCFTPMEPMPTMRPMNARIDLTAALKCIGRDAIVKLRVEIPGTSKAGVLLKAQQISVVFT